MGLAWEKTGNPTFRHYDKVLTEQSERHYIEREGRGKKDPDIEKQTTILYCSKTGTDNKVQALAFKPKKEAIILLKQKDIALQNRY